MKTSNLKLSIIAACLILMTVFTLNEAMAQRPGRGNSGDHHSRPIGPSRPSRPSYSRPPSYRPPYRPGYVRPYYRPYYRYNYYRPYLGLRINILPYGYYPFYFGPDQFYYSGGLFYRQYDNNYQVVVPPVGAEIPSIPAEAKEVTINGQTYYEYKGVYYNAVKNADGKTVYVVAGKDGVLNTDGNDPDQDGGPQVGDVVEQLPDGCREVFIKGEQYFVSEDGVYYEKTVSGDKVGYKVIGLGN